MASETILIIQFSPRYSTTKFYNIGEKENILIFLDKMNHLKMTEN